MPPQAYLFIGGLAWNYHRSRHDKQTISQFARRHKAATVAVVIGGVAWFLPHILLTAQAVVEVFDDSRPEIEEI